MLRTIFAFFLLLASAYPAWSSPPFQSLPEPLQPFTQAASSSGKVSGVFLKDRAFLRRMWLDLAGVLPEQSRVDAFVASNRNDKYSQEINFILQSAAFTERWTTFFADLFQNFTLLEESAIYRNALDDQLRTMVAANKPWDQMAREILTASGRGDSPNASMFFWAKEALEEVERLDYLDDQAAWITNVFLGIETNCISCHDGAGHLEQVNQGLSQMKRQQFWGLAAFLSSTYLYSGDAVQDEENEDNFFKHLQVGDLDKGPIANFDQRVVLTFADDEERQPDIKFFDGQYHADSRPGQGMRPPRRGGIIEAAYPFTGEKPLTGESRREGLARILTKDRQFSRNMVNRIWAHLFGEGFVEPLYGWDPLRTSDVVATANGLATQPKNSFLVEFLTDWFIQQQYDWRALIRLVVSSKVYQWDYVKVAPGEGVVDANDSWAYWRDNKRVRRLEAEAVAESYYRVMGIAPQYLVTGRGGKVHRNAWALPGPSEPSEAVFYLGVEDENNLPSTFYGLDTEMLIFDMERHREMMRVFGRGDYFNGVSRDQDVSIQNSLHLLNEESMNLWLEDPSQLATVSRFAQAFSSGSLNESGLITEVTRFILFRDPTSEEISRLRPHLSGKTATQATADLFWVLINHPDFIYK